MKYVFQKVLLNFAPYIICVPTEFAFDNILISFLGQTSHWLQVLVLQLWTYERPEL